MQSITPELQSFPMNIQTMKLKVCQAATLLKAISNENRLLILYHLVTDGEMSVGALNDVLDLSQSALSQHLAVLRKDGLVKTRKQAQTVYYSLTCDNTRQVLSLLHELYGDQQQPAH
ncbi:ArsR/SmtB family transcription factor [Spartinivicinus poritis]